MLEQTTLPGANLGALSLPAEQALAATHLKVLLLRIGGNLLELLPGRSERLLGAVELRVLLLRRLLLRRSVGAASILPVDGYVDTRPGASTGNSLGAAVALGLAGCHHSGLHRCPCRTSSTIEFVSPARLAA